MEYNAITELEQELLRVLKEEYSFYQSLYILIDKQRDLLRFDKEEKLQEIYADIEKYHARIAESEKKMSVLRHDNPRLFNLAASAPEVKKVAQCIVTLVRKNIDLIRENEDYANVRYERLKEELKNLQNSSKIIRYINDKETSSQFVDRRN